MTSNDRFSSVMERMFMLITAFALVVSVEMLVNIPNMDLPDIKDIPVLFPNLNP